MSTLRSLCQEHTSLTEEAIAALEQVEYSLPYLADITGTDVFIDVLTRNDVDSVVVAWASPGERSAYRRSVVGELAYPSSEPAVYRTLKTGQPSRDVRGVSQEGVPIAQTVVPIRDGAQNVIGVLIMERDISEELRQEEHVEFLSQTAERLSKTLMYLSTGGSTFDDWLGNGIFVLNSRGKITFANKSAAQMFRESCGMEPLGQDFCFGLVGVSGLGELLDQLKEPMEIAVSGRNYLFQAHPLVTYAELSGCVVSLQDITDLRRKEQALNAQSLVIKEIHHRVKNNLQNVAALLRLQMRRSGSEFIRAEFTESINRIISIAMVHEVFAHASWDFIDLKHLARRILEGLVHSAVLPGQTIAARVEGEEVELSSKQAVPLALVINELITNSLKHGIGNRPNGEIVVHIVSRGGQVILSVLDNGPEPAADFGQIPSNHLGLQIVDSLVREQLYGCFRMERCDGVTCTTVQFPVSSAEGD